jgi:hypothetical protein
VEAGRYEIGPASRARLADEFRTADGSFPDLGQDLVHELAVQKHACRTQGLYQRTRAVDLLTLFRAQDDPERADGRDIVRGGLTASGEVVEDRPSRPPDAVRNDLGLTGPEIPVLDAGDQRDILHAVLLCPFERGEAAPGSLCWPVLRRSLASA